MIARMSRNRIILITAGIMLSLFLASMEATVVATAMPTIVGQLGGLEHYSWVFSAYMLATTTTVPLYGKLSDIYGRRRLYLVAMTLFLLGSILCGQAQTMTQLILARGLQGLGAGGIMPLAFILIGEMFTLEQRARMQGLFSGVWGVSSVAGPLLGGFIVDQLSWEWVFYVNIIPGLLAAALVGFAWRDQIQRQERSVVDYAGAALLSASVVVLLIGLTVTEFSTTSRWALLGLSAILFAALVWVESHAVDPILPIALFRRERLFSTAIIHGVFAGWAMFGDDLLHSVVRPIGDGHERHAGRHHHHAAVDGLGFREHHWRTHFIEGGVSYSDHFRHIHVGDRCVLHVSHRRGFEPVVDDGLCRADGHRHGLFHPAVFDRRTNHGRAAAPRHCHFHDAIQPLHWRDDRRSV
jgi:MFS family permease